MTVARLCALCALTLSVGCATGAKLTREADAMKTRASAAREIGGYQCAPVALALAESHLEFLDLELSQGNSMRAKEHRDYAAAALTTVMEKVNSQKCKQQKPKPKPSDRDGDGIIDKKDACPDHPGPKKYRGCPDRDGDGIIDKKDHCPDEPEDMDGIQDEDGCPETEDRDGDGLNDPVDDCPDVPGPKSNKGCPITDRDRDGILDDVDQCPDEPEDKDGFEDEDGCPDVDNDGDGILDVTDKCPDLPETRNGFQDEDGCPDINPELVVVNLDLGKIEIKQKVFFDFNKAKIKPRSYRLLNEVAEAVLQLESGSRVRVEGHTDSVGGDRYNKKLSQRRADAVRTYLMEQGVEGSMLIAVGFGEEKPIESNDTKAGRDRNRRVEFTILDDEE